MSPSSRRRPGRRAAAAASVLVAVVVVAVVVGVTRVRGGDTPASSPAGPVAQVGATTITDALFQARLRSAVTAVQQGGGPQPGSSGYDAFIKRMRATVLESLITDTVIAQEAAYRGIAATDADVAAEIASDTQAAGGAAALATQLAEVGGSMDQLRDEARAHINEQRLEDVFAKDRADRIAARLAAGDPFATLAGELSDDDTSRPKGGDLGELNLAQLKAGDQAFYNAVSGLATGARTPAPVRDAAGYEILQAVGATPTTRHVLRILVAAPQPYTVKERPDWFTQSVLDAIAQDCSAGRIHVFLDAGVQPCTAPVPSGSASAPAGGAASASASP